MENRVVYKKNDPKNQIFDKTGPGFGKPSSPHLSMAPCRWLQMTVFRGGRKMKDIRVKVRASKPRSKVIGSYKKNVLGQTSGSTQPHSLSQKHTHTHTHIHTHRNTHSQTETHTPTQKHSHTHPHPHTDTHTLTHTLTHTQIHTHTHTHRNRRRNRQNKQTTMNHFDFSNMQLDDRFILGR